MLIQRLKQYAEQDPELRAQLSDAAFEPAPVRWVITIDEAGRFLGLIDRMGDDRRVSSLAIPKVGVRTVAVVPNFAVDMAGYVLGASSDSAERDLRKRTNQHAAFKELLVRAAQATADAGVKACVAFYEQTSELAALQAELVHRMPGPGDRYAFSLAVDDGMLVCQRPAAISFWNGHAATRTAARSAKALARGSTARAAAAAGGPAVGRCLCCGEMKTIADRHMTKIKPVPDGQPAGTSLISFNEEAFESYGWEAAFNSPTCLDCVEAYTRALNKLLRRDQSPRTRIDESGIATLYWSLGDDAIDLVALFEQADPQAVADLMRAPYTGRASAVELADSPRFCTLALSGSGGRVMVREWLDTTVAYTRMNLRRWFDELQMIVLRDQRRDGVTLREAGQMALPPRLDTLLAALVRDRRDIPKNVPPALLRAALTGEPLSAGILSAAVRRVAVERGAGDRWTAPARMGLIRVALNRMPGREGVPRMSEALDRNQTSQGYLCGRLLAVLEGIQFAAVGDVGADIVDRFYGRAASAPRAAFPILMRLAQSHLRTVKRDKPGLGVMLEREVQEIVALLPGASGFPAYLPLEEQGRFALGFYHQKAERFRRLREGTAQAEPAAS